MESILIQLYTGRKLKIRKLNGLEEQNVDDMLPPEKFMSQGAFRAVAAITEIDGVVFPTATSLVDLKDRMSRLEAGEKQHLLRIVNKHFGMPPEADELGNVSSVAAPEPVLAS